MSFWHKIQTGLEEGLETLSEKSIEWSKLAQLKWKRRSLQKEIVKEMVDLGGMVYKHHIQKTGDQLIMQSKGTMKNLSAFEKRLEDLEAEIQDLTERIDKTQIKGLKKDLEMGNGTIEQIVVSDDSRLIGKMLKDIRFPKNILVGTIVRDEKVIIPDGQTMFRKGDRVTMLGRKEDVEDVINKLGKESS